MPKLTIDQRDVEVPPGATILDAARELGIDIPALCFLQGYPPSTSCLACTVKVLRGAGGRLVPSCATAAEDGMLVESETEEVRQVRRSALELLLSDHLGDCLAPCYFACPANMDIPLMLRQIAAGKLRDALVTVKRAIALPAVLGRICPAPCEKACRRAGADGAVAICLLKRFAADTDLGRDDRYLPPCRPATGKRIAIVGAGPAGLAAAYYLVQQGHACTVFDENDEPGGRLRREPGEEELPRDVLDADIEPIRRLGVEFRMNTRIGRGLLPDDLQTEFDAVLLACGKMDAEQIEGWGLKAAPRGIQVDRQTCQTGVAGVFAAGCAVRGKPLVVRSVADGKEVATAIGQYLSGRPVVGPEKPFSTRIGRVEGDELVQFVQVAGRAPRREPLGGPRAGFTPDEAAQQAARCMRCDCRALQSCKLRKYAAIYAASPRRYQAQRRRFHQDVRHSEVIYEPGKCIACGLCIEITRAAGEPLGLTFVGRGFDVRVGVPLDRSLDEALRKAAAECVAACPTAALALKDE